MQNVTLQVEKLDFSSNEAFNTFRTNVEFSGENIRVVSITSSTPGEGKSSVSFELARAYAKSGKKTLLIDADMRKSVMRSRRNKSGKVRFGLSNYLVGQTPIEEAICETNVENFYLIYAGPVPPNPSELLIGSNFSNLIKWARENFEMVVIDTPPLGSVIDSVVISKECDGAVMVIESGAISHSFANKVKEQLEVSECKILGVVLNKVDTHSGKGYYGKYYGRYYGKYYGKYGDYE